MNIVFFEIQGWEKDYLKKSLKGHKITFSSEPLTTKNVAQTRDAEVISVFVYSKTDKKILSKLSKLKLITTRSTGFDHIDLKATASKKITVCNVPFYGENTVAEHTFALILALSRNVHKSYVRTLKDDFSIDGLIGFDLKGKTLGVIGAGHIGMHVIKMAKGFGMNVLAFDMHRDAFLKEVLDYEYASIDTILKKSDIISLHVPYNKHTHHLIGREEFKKIKKGAILINTARGAIVDTDALIKAIENGRLGGAGLDVLEGEELIKEEKQILYSKTSPEKLKQIAKDQYLLDKENVVYTPHIAFYSKEALQRIIETTAENIKSFSTGSPKNLVK